MENKFRILYLDDEVHNLYAFRANFRKYFDVLIAPSSSEAIQLLHTQLIHVFVVDQKLGSMLGTDLIRKTSKDFPEIMHILVSGCLEDEAFLREISSCPEIFRYIKKPWSEVEFKNALEDAVKSIVLK